jgi:hypothetical protein
MCCSLDRAGWNTAATAKTVKIVIAMETGLKSSLNKLLSEKIRLAKIPRINILISE